MAEEVVPVRRHGEEELEKEERDDREVVAGEASRRQADEEADDRADHDDERDRDERRQVDAVVIRAEQRIGVGADAEEGDVAEVEQAAPADDDVEAEREQHVDGDVERHPAHVAAVGHHRHEAEQRDERRQPRPPGDDAETLLERRRGARPRRDGCRRGARPTRRDPPPGSSAPRTSTPRARLRAAGSARRRSRRSRHTFRMSALPRMPCGRNRGRGSGG